MEHIRHIPLQRTSQQPLLGLPGAELCHHDSGRATEVSVKMDSVMMMYARNIVLGFFVATVMQRALTRPACERTGTKSISSGRSSFTADLPTELVCHFLSVSQKSWHICQSSRTLPHCACRERWRVNSWHPSPPSHPFHQSARRGGSSDEVVSLRTGALFSTVHVGVVDPPGDDGADPGQRGDEGHDTCGERGHNDFIVSTRFPLNAPSPPT
jgi:hypothetical protein